VPNVAKQPFLPITASPTRYEKHISKETKAKTEHVCVVYHPFTYFFYPSNELMYGTSCRTHVQEDSCLHLITGWII